MLQCSAESSYLTPRSSVRLENPIVAKLGGFLPGPKQGPVLLGPACTLVSQGGHSLGMQRLGYT
jgi:hypothetical protein